MHVLHGRLRGPILRAAGALAALVLAGGSLATSSVQVRAGSTTSAGVSSTLTFEAQYYGLIALTAEETGDSYATIATDLGNGESLDTISGDAGPVIIAFVDTAYAHRLMTAVDDGIVTQAEASADESAYDATVAQLMADPGTDFGFTTTTRTTSTTPPKPVSKPAPSPAPTYIYDPGLVQAILATSVAVTGQSTSTIVADLQSGESFDTIDGSDSATVAADVVAAFSVKFTHVAGMCMGGTMTAPSTSALAAQVSAIMAEPGTELVAGTYHVPQPTKPATLSFHGTANAGAGSHAPSLPTRGGGTAGFGASGHGGPSGFGGGGHAGGGGRGGFGGR